MIGQFQPPPFNPMLHEQRITTARFEELFPKIEPLEHVRPGYRPFHVRMRGDFKFQGKLFHAEAIAPLDATVTHVTITAITEKERC